MTNSTYNNCFFSQIYLYSIDICQQLVYNKTIAQTFFVLFVILIGILIVFDKILICNVYITIFLNRLKGREYKCMNLNV